MPRVPEDPESLAASAAIERSSVIEKGMVLDAATIIVPVSQPPTDIPQPPSGIPVASATQPQTPTDE